MRLAAAVVMGALALAAGCGDGIDRWEGEGCQPACLTHDSDGTRYTGCVTPGGSLDKCREMDESNVSCPGGGQPSCESGKPRCPDEDDPEPTCVP